MLALRVARLAVRHSYAHGGEMSYQRGHKRKAPPVAEVVEDFPRGGTNKPAETGDAGDSRPKQVRFVPPAALVGTDLRVRTLPRPSTRVATQRRNFRLVLTCKLLRA